MSEQYPGGFITKSPVLPDGTTASGIWNLSQQAAYQAAGTWPAYSVPDQYFNYVTALFHGDGTNGAAYGGGSASSSVTPFNNDASGNAVVVTPVNTTQANRINPYQPGYYSNYFGGTSDYLSLASSTPLSLGTGDFTVEGWFYANSTASQPAILNLGDNTTGLIITLYLSKIYCYYLTGGGVFGGGATVSTGQWYHFAWVRNGGVQTFYLNGVSDGTPFTDSSSHSSSGGVGIGWSNAGYSGFNKFNGYISNVRVVKGTAVYTSSFTPPTIPLTAIANTSLLTCQSNRFIDNSTYAATITLTGTPSVSALQPFTLSTSYATYGSGSFPGSSYWTAPTTSNVAFGTGDFTIEAWIFPTSTTNYRNIFSSRGTAATSVWFGLDTGTLTPTLFTDVSVVASSIPVKLNGWSHVALVRISGTTTIYVNGVSGGSASNTTNYAGTVCNMDPSYVFAGFITDFRIVKGTGVYTTTFTPPTSPLTAVTGTALLTFQYNGATNNNGFIDSSPNNFNVTRYASGTQGTVFALGPTSGAFGPYGTRWSMYSTSGASNYLSLPSVTLSGDFTAECWVYGTSGNAATYPWIAFTIGNPSASTGFECYALGDSYSNAFVFYSNGSRTGTTFTGLAYSDVWNHVAVVRSGSTISCYINGSRAGTTSNSSTFSGSVSLGSNQPTYSDASAQYISNFRLVTGTAVYSGSSYIVPTSPLTAISGTTYLACASNSFKEIANNSTVTVNGTPSVQAFNPFGQSTAYNPAVNGASAYFPGGTYLTKAHTWNSLEVANNAALRLGTSSDFTIECWAYLSSTQNNVIVADAVVDEGTGNNTGWYISVFTDRTVNFGATGTNYITAPYIPAFNSWVHLALVRNSGTTTIYVNGVSSGSTSSTINMNAATDVRSDTPWTIGCIEHYYWSGCLGYISDFRVTNTAVYTSSFTPNTTPLTAVAGTQLLLNMNANGIYDNAEINPLITAGNVRVSTDIKKYGTGSMYFDGSSDGLYSATSIPNMQFGTGDFTIEMWVYTSNLAAYQTLADTRSSDTTAAYGLFINDSGYPYWFDASSSQTSTTAVTSNTWTHIAFVRGSGTLRIFVNGTQGYSGSNTNTQNPTNKLVLGMNISQSAPYLGYIDDFRVTKGVARYTSTFTPPTKAFPNYGPN